jgi:hypothetical protein
MFRNCIEYSLQAPEKISPEFKMLNLSMGLASSAHDIIQYATELIYGSAKGFS